MSYIYIYKPTNVIYTYGAPFKARNFNVVYIYIYTVYIYVDLRLATLKAVSFYLLHNVSMHKVILCHSCV
jgi:hypothetical protein